MAEKAVCESNTNRKNTFCQICDSFSNRKIDQGIDVAIRKPIAKCNVYSCTSEAHRKMQINARRGDKTGRTHLMATFGDSKTNG